KTSRNCSKTSKHNSFMAKIVIRNLTKTYSGGAVVALQDIDLQVAPNESLCVLGPSGCGKTTLLRIIDCLIVRDRGDVLIDGALDAQTRELMQEELLRILETEQKTMIFVTHSIDEAIVLGDRIVVMSCRPGRIREIFPVDIPRPRKILTVRSHPRYIELRNTI